MEQLEQIAAHNGVPLPQLDAGGNAVQGVQAFLQDVGVAMQNQVQNAAVAVPILAQAAQQAVNLAQGAVALAQQQNSEERRSSSTSPYRYNRPPCRFSRR